jgi:hypothetical protein
MSQNNLLLKFCQILARKSQFSIEFHWITAFFESFRSILPKYAKFAVLQALFKQFTQNLVHSSVVLDAGSRLRLSIMGSNPRPVCHLQGSLEAKIMVRPYQAHSKDQLRLLEGESLRRRTLRKWVSLEPFFALQKHFSIEL